MIDGRIACSPAQHKRTRLFSPEAHSSEAKLAEWEGKQLPMELGENDRDARDHALGKVAEDMESTPFYGDISGACTLAEWAHERPDKDGGDDTIEVMRNRIHYKDYRDGRNLPFNSTSSIFASETISNPHADQLILWYVPSETFRVANDLRGSFHTTVKHGRGGANENTGAGGGAR